MARPISLSTNFYTHAFCILCPDVVIGKICLLHLQPSACKCFSRFFLSSDGKSELNWEIRRLHICDAIAFHLVHFQ